jgi:hypothetical protein
MPRKEFDNAAVELQALETELLTLLRAQLSEIVEGRETLFFFNEEYNPHKFPAHRLSNTSSEALKLAHRTLELRALLMLPTEQSAGQLFIGACTESADLNNPHRLGPRRLAARLLSQIQNREN